MHFMFRHFQLKGSRFCLGKKLVFAMAERPGEGFDGVAAPPNHTEEAAPPGKATQDTPGTDADAKTVLSRKTFACLAAAYTVEGVDSQLLSTCLFALQRDIDLTLHQIAILTTAQMIFANLAAPFWGILADRQVLRRRSILAFGCIGVGSAVTVMSLVSSMLPLVFLRAMCGFFLASLKPVSIGRWHFLDFSRPFFLICPIVRSAL